jgi:hypothetical protein
LQEVAALVLAKGNQKRYADRGRHGVEECPLPKAHHVWEDDMGTAQRSWSVDRRTILKTSAVIAAVQITSPFIIKARGEAPVRIGMVDPLTGVYAAIAQDEQIS